MAKPILTGRPSDFGSDAMKNDVYETSDPIVLVKDPRVSVLMITYNHADYLAEAIDGVVNQKCDFPFELIIGEDASSDTTREIAIKYQERYPNIIRVVYSASNVGMNANSLRIFTRARGKYVAYCEGDDFWCAQDKLARQVALMENDHQISIIHTDWTRATLQKGVWKHDISRSIHRRTHPKYLSGNIFRTWHYPKTLRTCTILLRSETMRQWYESGLMDSKYLFGDSVLNSWVTEKGLVAYLPMVTAVYRVSPNSALRSGAKSRVAFYKSSLQFDTAARIFFSRNSEYPSGYRWESAIGLLLWSLRARDFQAAKYALIDIGKHFTLVSFIAESLKSIAMRTPTIRHQHREASSYTMTKAKNPQ